MSALIYFSATTVLTACLHALIRCIYALIYYTLWPHLLHTLREISGTYWLIYVSLAIVSRLTRIIRSIDPTVAYFQVNDPDL